MPKLLTGEEVVNEIFGGNLGINKLYRMAGRGLIPALKVQGRWYFPLDDIKDWIKENSRTKAAVKKEQRQGTMAAIEE